MPVSIISPPQRREEEDGLDKLAKALTIARLGFGIYSDTQSLGAAKQKAKQEQDLFARQMSGEVDPIDVLKAGGQVSDEESPGALAMTIRGEDGPVVKYVKPKSGEGMSPLAAAMQMEEFRGKKLTNKKTQQDLDAKDQPFNQLSEPDKEIVRDTAKKFADTAAMKESMDQVLSILEDPNIPQDQKTIAALGSLKLVNSASLNSPDVVGVEEAKRAGAFLNPSAGNWLPGQPGPGPFSPPNVKAYTQQLRMMSDGLGTKAQSMKSRIESAGGQPLRSALAEGVSRKNVVKSDQPYSLDVVQYAKAHNISLQRALGIKEKRMSEIGSK